MPRPHGYTVGMSTTPSSSVPVTIDDPINARILAVSEDQISGFVTNPFAQISERSGVELDVVVERIREMVRAGTIRRVRLTMLANKLAPGALVAWNVSQEDLNATFDYLFQHDPFSGHVVIRTTDGDTPGSVYRLWTTLKVPQGYSMEKHCDLLCKHTGAVAYRLMPALKLFKLGVGHIRRRTLEPGARTDDPAAVIDAGIEPLSDKDWQVITALKREFEPDEITPDPWRARADEAGVSFDEFCSVAQSLDERGVVGRFSTFLEHVKPTAGGQRVTRYNALFHWRVPKGRELDAGMEVGRHHCMTHAYWREGGPEFANVNIMGVTHGMEKDRVLAHKAAMDEHLAEAGIEVDYTNVFWGGRSEIKPSEIAPDAYVAWCEKMGVDPATMKA